MTDTMDIRRRYDVVCTQKQMIEKRHDEAEARLKKTRADQIDIDAVQRTVQFVAARIQTGFGNYVGGIVTKALHHVFPDRRTDNFIVRFVENRGKTECELLLRTANGEEGKPIHCAGGGVWDTLAFALRAAVLVLEQPAPSRILILDEPFKFLHGAAVRRLALRMMYNTFKALSIQAVVVHQSDVGVEDEIDESLDVVKDEVDVTVYEVRKTGYEKCEVVKL